MFYCGTSRRGRRRDVGARQPRKPRRGGAGFLVLKRSLAAPTGLTMGKAAHGRVSSFTLEVEEDLLFFVIYSNNNL